MKPDRVAAPFGSWKSPITAERIGREIIEIKEIGCGAASVYWIESRPAENGRSVIVQWDRTYGVRDVLPAPYDAASKVHEYGGGAFTVAGEAIVFSNADDQRLYCVQAGGRPAPITAEAPWRFADGCFDRSRNRLLVIRERHDTSAHPVNEIVAVDMVTRDQPRVLVGGADFYSAPRLSPDGRRLAWLSWNRPSMPWTGTELWVAELTPQGSIRAPVQAAGGPGESIFQPEWSPRGNLHFVSDRSGWWNIYRWTGEKPVPLASREADFGQPQWEFGLSNYAFISEQRILCSYAVKGVWRLAVLELNTGRLRDLPLPYTDVTHVCGFNGKAVVRAGSASEGLSVVLIEGETGAAEIIRRPVDAPDWRPHYSTPFPIEYPSAGSRTAHAFFFAPSNAAFIGPPNEKPPLIVRCHGGPAYAASPALDPKVQYWTSMGFAVMLVNYGGSSNYGREYRQRLEGRWGEVDLEDVCAAVPYAGDQGLADPRRAAISGQSAGGYLVLCALAWTNVFRAGACYYGVSDVELLQRSTHKFESHYIERLVGAPPQQSAEYRRRSPLYRMEHFSAPVIFFQGADDAIAPAGQTLHMLQALREKGLPALALLLSGERHGFVQGDHVRRALEAELFLYAITFLKAPLQF